MFGITLFITCFIVSFIILNGDTLSLEIICRCFVKINNIYVYFNYFCLNNIVGNLYIINVNLCHV